MPLPNEPGDRAARAAIEAAVKVAVTTDPTIFGAVVVLLRVQPKDGEPEPVPAGRAVFGAVDVGMSPEEMRVLSSACFELASGACIEGAKRADGGLGVMWSSEESKSP